MDMFRTLFDVIDIRSFSNIWYWIALASVWTVVTQSVLGVPVDMIGRARREGGQVMADVEDLCRIKVLRLCGSSRAAGSFGILGVSMVLSLLLVSGFVYGAEIAQALFLLVFPLVVTGVLGLRTAHRLMARNPAGAELCDELNRLRMAQHAVSLVALCVTAVWGMSRNLHIAPFGG